MKKSLLLLAVTALSVFSAVAAEPAAPAKSAPQPAVAEPPRDYDWTFIAFSFGKDIPVDAATTSVYGVKIGVPASGGPAPVYGVEGSILYAGTDEVNGVQASLITTDSKETTGLQFSLVNFSVKVAGLQLGIVNIADDEAFQLGIVNIIRNSPMPCLPIVNAFFK